MIALACGGTVTAALLGHALSGEHLPGAALSTALFFLISALALRSVALTYPHDRLGFCNTVTLLRGALAAAIAAPLAAPGLLATDPMLAWGALAVAVLALALDGLDGWLARRSGLASDFGARFDMEVDSLLGLILACLALANAKAGLWILALGLMRYVYILAGLALPWLQADLPQRFRRKAVCVVQIAVLTLLLAPGLPALAATALAASATLLLAWSFAVDILWLARRR